MSNKITVYCLLTLILSFAYSWSPHNLFTWSSDKSSHVTYTHRLLINRPVQIPCFKSTDTPPDHSHLNSTIYWSHRGFKLTATESPFLSAYWDDLGTLIISCILPRQINLWCHYRGPNVSSLFVHRIDFTEATFTQTIFAVDINASLTTNLSKAYQEFLYSQKSNCGVQLQGGGLAVLKGAPNIDLTRAVYQKRVVLEAALDACEAGFDCLGVSLDFFECWVNMVRKTALYSIDFSIMHTVDVGVFVNDDGFALDTQIQKTISRVVMAVKRTKPGMVSSGFGRMKKADVSLELTVQNRTVRTCLGVAGKPHRSFKGECVLCPAGSFSRVDITLPPPPEESLDMQSGDLDSNQEFLENVMWPYADSRPSCRPCPACSYAETLGRPSCLPCPAWHSTPIYGSIPGEGGEWIDSVCPRKGRRHVLLNDFVKETFGYEPVGKWFEGLSELTRVSIYVVALVVSTFGILAAIVIVYRCIDVAGMLSAAARELRPLYLEAALVLQTMRRIEQGRRARAVARLRQLLKENPNRSRVR
ncbi:unnamed protein product [Mesocestoides corti]|uniref:Ephrin_rec_like domain-containing protein n=1 Tax=Mesocestoides corti TaxID=53468 RepID=A0A0R3UEC2_MESCO|nr:unnamed protein product [Mesocestoides corti]